MLKKNKKNNEKEWQKKVNEYLNEEQVEEKEAEIKAERYMVSEDSKAFFEIYKDYILRMRHLEDSAIHSKIDDMVQTLIDQGAKESKAIKRVLHRVKDDFDDLFIESSDEEEDEGEESDEGNV